MAEFPDPDWADLEECLRCGLAADKGEGGYEKYARRGNAEFEGEVPRAIISAPTFLWLLYLLLAEETDRNVLPCLRGYSTSIPNKIECTDTTNLYEQNKISK
jgi:hypothetical protein